MTNARYLHSDLDWGDDDYPYDDWHRKHNYDEDGYPVTTPEPKERWDSKPVAEKNLDDYGNPVSGYAFRYPL